jgi:integrase
MQWSQVDLARGLAVLNEHKTAKKTGRPRLIQLPEAAVRLLRRIRARVVSHVHVFTAWTGRPWVRNGFGQSFRRLRAKAGLPPDAVPYGCRHAFATNAALGDQSSLTIAQLLGHQGTRMAERYCHLAGETAHLAAAAEQAARRGRRGPA